MLTGLYDYDLPARLVAQEPAPRRDDARLMVLDRTGGASAHRRFKDLPDLLSPGDLVVVNDTRVLRARLDARRASGGRVEVLLVAPATDGAWLALVRPAGRLREGEVVRVGDIPALVMARRLDGGKWLVRATGDETVEALMGRAGHVPLPPYIQREDRPEDAERYQTVYARAPGAIAAPTAGLHFTSEVLAALVARNVRLAALTLHVGPGTFRPVVTADLDDHRLDPEPYEVPPETLEAVRSARAEGRRVVAVGTTVVRALEAVAREAPQVGATDLFVREGFEFRWVDALITNFHLPRTTLLALVAAFVGRERVLAAYQEAVGLGYRFYSYGDAMLIR